MIKRWAGWVLLIAVVTPGARVQAQSPARAGDSTAIAPNAAYGAGALHRWLFGRHYRDLWRTPLEVDVMDLKTFAGGVKPVSRGGRRQTLSLWLRDRAGRTFAFRSIDKDPSS